MERDLSSSVARQMGWATGGANAAGALLAYGYLTFLAPGALQRHGSLLQFVLIAVLVPIYLAATGVIGTLQITKSVDCWAGPLSRGDTLTPDQRRAAIGLPTQVSVVSAVAWVGAAALFGSINAAFGNPGEAVVRVVVGILFAGAVTVAITYLMAERRYRPVMALILCGHADERRGKGVRGRLVTSWLVGSALPLTAVALVPLAHTRSGVISLPVSIASLAVIGVVAGYFLTRAAATSVSEPLDGVRRALDGVRRGDLSVEVAVDDTGEVGRLQADVNSMVTGLRDRRRLEELFGRHVGEEVARQALAEEAVLGGRQLAVAVLVVDLVGSTKLALSRPPDEVVMLLNAFFGCVVEAVSAEGGWVNKFEGDGALCVFGAPAEMPGRAAAALRAARRLRQMLEEATARHPGIDAGIGVAGGTAVAGNIGAVDRYEYTVIGDPVNEAARLSELAKLSPARVMASGAVVGEAGDEAVAWCADSETVLRGRGRPTVVMVPVPAGQAEAVAQPPATAGTIDTV